MRAITLLGIALLVLPTGLASWASGPLAAQEPTTPLDDPQFMWMDPPMGGFAPQVYLDLVYSQGSAFNPLPHYEALLGVWRDCNQDGLVGNVLGETYSSFFLLDTSVCPPGSRHHDGVVVTEFLWIGPGAPWPHIDDPLASVWMDALVPGEIPIGTKGHVDDELILDPSGPRWFGLTTFLVEPAHATGYARLGPATLQYATTPAGGQTFPYGAGNCASIPGPIQNGWVCDPQQWVSAVAVGDPYHMRDVDCVGPC